MIAPDYPMLYGRLGRLLEASPDFTTYHGCSSQPTLAWLGRAGALVSAVGANSNFDNIQMTQSVNDLRTASWTFAVTAIFQILYRALAECEIHLPAGASGEFIPVSNSFDAFAAISRIFAEATLDVNIVDPYMDDSALTTYGVLVPNGFALRLLAGQQEHKASLIPAARAWRTQYSDTRPLQLRLAPAKSLHDRALFIDKRQAWTLTQSLKDFAKRSPAEIVRADSTASLKIEAYDQIWAASTIIV